MAPAIGRKPRPAASIRWGAFRTLWQIRYLPRPSHRRAVWAGEVGRTPMSQAGTVRDDHNKG